jgi:hypothetical protein
MLSLRLPLSTDFGDAKPSTPNVLDKFPKSEALEHPREISLAMGRFRSQDRGVIYWSALRSRLR